MINTQKLDMHLEKYEIKKPDYDLIERDISQFDNVKLDVIRYKNEDGVWRQKSQKKGLFAKKTAKLMIVGDITCFEKQFDQAKTEEGFDFKYEFEKVKPIFEQADLVIGNLETMIFPNAPYRTEKYVAEQNFNCNAPIEFLEAVRYAGFDMVTNSNNHHLDTGAIGIGETIKNIEKFGLIQTGTFREEKRRFEIVEVNGIKLAIVAVTSEHNNLLDNLSKEGQDFLVNDYSKEKAQAFYDEAKKLGADGVIVCIHWGKENRPKPVKQQEQIAKELADIGYDCIIGSHPHVLQPFTFVESSSGKKVPLFYSMGNFVSHNANNAKARTIIACLDIKKNGKEVEIDCSYIPLITSNALEGKKYVVCPLSSIPKQMRNIDRLKKIKEVVGKEIKINKSYRYSEVNEPLDLETREKFEFDASKLENTEGPVSFEDYKFKYNMYKDHVEVAGFSQSAHQLSYAIPSKVEGLEVTGVAAGAFANNHLVKKMNFRKGVTSISEELFKNCDNLEGFQIAPSTTEVKREAFAGCVKLGGAVLKNKVTKIEEKAFAGCTGLRSAKLPDSIIQIADDAFEGCDNVVFYCSKDSYAAQYAKAHGIEVIEMTLNQ